LSAQGGIQRPLRPRFRSGIPTSLLHLHHVLRIKIHSSAVNSRTFDFRRISLEISANQSATSLVCFPLIFGTMMALGRHLQSQLDMGNPQKCLSSECIFSQWIFHTISGMTFPWARDNYSDGFQTVTHLDDDQSHNSFIPCKTIINCGQYDGWSIL
jgi:hypothetical protein